MSNEFILMLHAVGMGIFSLLSLRLGKEALVSFITICCILANLFVLKQITLCGLTASASDAYSIGAIVGLNLLQEYYGASIARKTIVINCMLFILYALGSFMQIWYIPCVSDIMHAHYSAILTVMPRIIIASLLVYAIVQYFDTWFYGLLKTLFSGRYLVLRNCISIIVCQLLDTVLFSYAGLYAIVPNLSEIIAISYGIKLGAIGISVPFIALSQKIIPKKTQPESSL